MTILCSVVKSIPGMVQWRFGDKTGDICYCRGGGRGAGLPLFFATGPQALVRVTPFLTNRTTSGDLLVAVWITIPMPIYIAKKKQNTKTARNRGVSWSSDSESNCKKKGPKRATPVL